MISEYVEYFDSIPTKTYDGNDRFLEEKLDLIDNNLIIFKSTSEYNFLNFYLIANSNEKDQIDFQLIYLKSYQRFQFVEFYHEFLIQNFLKSFVNLNHPNHSSTI